MSEVFHLTHYAVTAAGGIMPCRWLGMDEDRVQVEAPNGRRYTIGPGRILSEHDGQVLIRERKRAEVAETYRFDLLYSGDNLAVVRVYLPGTDHDHVVMIMQERQICSCQAFEKSGQTSCKHLDAVEVWERREVARQEQIEADMEAACRGAQAAKAVSAADEAPAPGPSKLPAGPVKPLSPAEEADWLASLMMDGEW